MDGVGLRVDGRKAGWRRDSAYACSHGRRCGQRWRERIERTYSESQVLTVGGLTQVLLARGDSRWGLGQ